MEPKTPHHHRKFKLRHQPVGVFLLLLMTIYGVNLILRLDSSTDSFQASDLFVYRTSQDNETLKTHIISSKENSLQAPQEDTRPPPATIPCSDLINGAATTSTATSAEGLLCCDRSHFRTDVCFLKGDIRTNSTSSSILVYHSIRWNNIQQRPPQPPETIRPYTRKWETEIMITIDELMLIPVAAAATMGDSSNRSMTSSSSTATATATTTCDVRHKVPAVVFSTGGYTGNLYHEFSDGLLPLYITTERFRREVVLVVLEYHSWWAAKYAPLVKALSNYKLVDFGRDRRVHCFPEMIVGLKIHGELTINPQLMPTGKGIQDFQALLGQVFGRSPSKHTQPTPPLPSNSTPTTAGGGSGRKPKLVIFIRNRSRVLLNLRDVVRACQKNGFQVQILNPKRNTPVSNIFAVLNSADAMLAVHGAATTHFLFMRPGSVLIQIVPLGLDWPAGEFYGQPARRLGLEYVEYKVLPEESSLWREYDRRDPVIVDPHAVTGKGWLELKRVYLDHQNVRVNIRRFSKLLARGRSYIIRKSQPQL